MSSAEARRFEHEAHVLALLKHPNIAQVYGAGTAELDGISLPYFALELVDGSTLTKFCAENDLSVRQRLALFMRVGEAVQHAHQKGVIHRDLKPDNILIDTAGRPKVFDFGVARVTNSDVQTTTLHTNVGQVVGTLSYMSPEQASGNPNDVDIRSDVYALGVILFELLTGRLPHNIEGKMIHEAVRDIREVDAPHLASLDRSLRGDLDTIVAKALRKDKETRYQSAIELVDDIGRYLQGQPIVARDPTLAYQLKLMIKRRPALFTAVAAFVLLVGAFLGYAFTKSQQLSRERQARLEQASRSLDAYKLFEEASDLTDRRVKLDRAAELLRRAVDLDPSFALGYFELAELERSRLPSDLSKVDEVTFASIIGHYETAHEVAGKDGFPRALLAAGMMCRDFRKLDEALEYFTAAADAGLNDVYARVARAEVLELQHRRDEALELLETLTTDPIGSQMGEVWGSLGLIYVRQRVAQGEESNPEKNCERAVAALREATRIAPTKHVYWGALGLALRDCGGHDEALAAYRRGAELAPHEIRYPKNIAIVLYERQRFTEAVDVYLDIVRREDSVPFDIFNLAQLYREAKQPAEAIVQLRRYVEAVPKDIRGYQAMISSAIEADDAKAALDGASAAVRALPDEPGAWHLLGGEQLRQGMIDQARQSFDRGCQLGKPSVANEVGMARVEEARGRYEPAKAMLVKLAEEFPDSNYPTYALAKLHWNHFTRESSYPYLRQTILLEAKNARSLNYLAEDLAELGAYDMSIAAYRRALEVVPQDGWAMVNLARGLLTCKDESLRDPKRALELMSGVLRQLPSHADVADWYALALLANARYAEAEKAIAHAIDMHGKDVRTLLWSAIVQFHLGRENRARVDYYAALDMLERDSTEESKQKEYLDEARTLLDGQDR